MTLEHHRCRSGQGRVGFAPVVHHLPIYHRCTIAPLPSKPSSRPSLASLHTGITSRCAGRASLASAVTGCASATPPGGRICLRCGRIHSAGRSSRRLLPSEACFSSHAEERLRRRRVFPATTFPTGRAIFGSGLRWRLGRWGVAVRAARISPLSRSRESGARE
uniref:Uncharacterized protein n=1 Tax=Oryza glumipatula TaxID=40148 RepID=A0A0E0B6M7_9ORYZ